MNLKRAAYAASRWTTTSTLAATGTQLVQTVVLARILVPDDFGLMAIVVSIVAVLSLLVDLGLSQALIHYDDVPVESRSSIYWLNMLLALALMIALLLAAPLVGRAYGSDALVSVLRWTSPMFLLAAAGQQLRALAAKALRFDRLAVIEVAASTMGLAAAIVVAVAGGGVYALVAAAVLRTGAGSLLAWLVLSPAYRPRWHFRAGDARPYLGFGGYSVGETLANEVHRNADVFAGGLVVGPAAMGVYAVPRDLSMQASRMINGVVTRVGFPVMSRVKNDPARLRNIYLQTLRMTASVNFPLYVFIGLFASEVVALLYGPQWQAAVWYLQILAAWGLIRSTGNPSGSLIYAVGKARRAFWWNSGLLLILPPLYWLATWMHGLPGLASGVLLLQALIVVPAWYFLVKPCCGATLGEYLSQFGAPLLCAVTAGLAAWAVAHDLPHGTLRLAVGGAVGGLTYLALSWVLNRRWVDAMRELLWLKRTEMRDHDDPDPDQ